MFFRKNRLGKAFVCLMLSLFLGLGSLVMPVTSSAAEITVTVTGDGVTTPKTFSQTDLEAMTQVQAHYSSINTYPTKKMHVARGVKLTELLGAAGLKDEATLIKVSASDGFNVTFTRQELLGNTRYYYPGLKANDEYAGYIAGSTEGAVPVDAILALANAEGDSFANLSSTDAPILMIGQRWVTEQTNSAYVKKVSKIEVFTTTPEKWDTPTAQPASGTVAAGTMVALSNLKMDTDKVYYTTDGTEPTVQSPMYNWIASRWWNSRPDDLATINHPIEITQDTVIKAKTIGMGKEDSDVATFNYQVPLGVTSSEVTTKGDISLSFGIPMVDPTGIGAEGQFTVLVAEQNVAVSAVLKTSTADKIKLELAAKVKPEQAVTVAYAKSDDVNKQIKASNGKVLESFTAQAVKNELAWPAGPALIADNTNNEVGKSIDITFTDNADWRAAISEISVDGTALDNSKYSLAAGTITIDQSVFASAKDYAVVVKANGYSNATVTQPVVAASAMDVLFNGTVSLTPDENFTVKAKSGTDYTVSKTTPLGALQAAAAAGNFTYGITDKKYADSGILLLDDVGTYVFVKNGSKWYAYVNDVYKDGYANADDALNKLEVKQGDKVEFYFAGGISDASNLNAVKAAATAAVKTVVSTGVAPTDWTLQLSGAKNASVNKAYFEQGLACTSSGHQVTWTDADNNVWGGVPLWLLVAMVDDDPDNGSKHINFNDELAAKHYKVEVIAGDGWSAIFDSADIARNNGYLVANTLNGQPLPLKTESEKDCWPLYLKGSAVFGGQQVGNITRIKLSDLPVPSAGWTLEMVGQVGDTITQQEFEEALACTGSNHYKTWTDKDNNVWSGVPLWVLLGAVDDIETGSHWTFQDNLAAQYNVKVSSADFSKTFAGSDVANSDAYIVANKCNDQPLATSGPLRLVGSGVTKTDGSLGGASVGSIVKIEIPELQTPQAASGSWNLTLKGKINDVIAQAEFEAALACPNSGHSAEWTDADGNKWSGIPLRFLTGWIDDRQPHAYNVNQASAGYTILVKAQDGYTKDFSSKDVTGNSNYIIANKCNGAALTDSWPLRLVGVGVSKDGALTGFSVGKIAEIELTSFETALPVPQLHIVKYAEDQKTIIDEKTIDYQWMEKELAVIGDGTTVYKYEGITNNPNDLWDENETCPGGHKIANAIKGTRIKDLCELVGGMGSGTDIVLVAKDGYKTILPYSSIYTDPSVQARQGDAILAWWGDGKYVPDYMDGMRIFFTPEDKVYGQWDMHETLPENYWHYYYSDKIQYPSCAGLSSKYITEIKIYSVPQGDWTLELDGRDIGGINENVSKTYFESALACQFGANHKVSYTDPKARVWEGMPLWFLAGFVDDDDKHSDNAFNNALATAGYQVVITAKDGSSVTIDSKDIIRNSNYIIANSLNGALIPDADSNWPLRLVGPSVSGSTSIGQIASVKLKSIAAADAVYTVVPASNDAYTAGTTPDGINTMTVKDGISGFTYFTVNITPVKAHSGNETVVFTHMRNGVQLGINATGADFDQVNSAQAGFNVQPGDVIKAYIVDALTNDKNVNPIVLQ